MPSISVFYGITVYMYRELGGKHHRPHIHARFGEYEVVVAFDGEILEGKLPIGKQKLLEAWIEIHFDDLNANWQLLQSGEKTFRISPLR